MKDLRLPVPPAPLLEECFEYTNGARYMALYWEPAGDEAMVSDGSSIYTSHYRPYQNYIGLLQRMGLEADLGSSEQVASEWLVVDLLERKLMIAPVMEARTFLDKQWPAPDSPVYYTPKDLEALVKNFFENLPEPDEPDPEDTRKQLRDLEGSWAELECWIANVKLNLDPEWPAPFNLVDIFKEAGQELAEISAKWETFIAGHEDEAMDWFIALYEELEVSNISDDPRIVDLADMLANMLSGGHIKMINLGKNNAIQLWNEIPWNSYKNWNEIPLWDLTLRFFKTPTMACGHTANATDEKGDPVCVLCAGANPGAQIIVSTPDLTGRMAKCAECSRQTQSSVSLAYFKSTPDKETDSYYCGCWGWN